MVWCNTKILYAISVFIKFSVCFCDRHWLPVVILQSLNVTCLKKSCQFYIRLLIQLGYNYKRSTHNKWMGWNSVIVTNYFVCQTKLKMLYVFFWVIPRRLNFMCRHFRTLCLFQLLRQVGVEWLNLRIVGVTIWGKVWL